MRIRQQRRRGWLPAAAGTVAGASTSSALGAVWAEAISSTSSAIYVIGLSNENGQAGETLSIGTGAAGAEVVAASVVVGSYGAGYVNLPIPLRIPASTRVSLRHSYTAITSNMTLAWIPETVGSLRPYLLPGASSTAVASANSSGTSWVQAVASTSAACYLTEVLAGSSAGTPGTFDVGIGAAASEVAVFSATIAYVSGNYNFHAITPRVPLRIPAATRIAIRAPSSNWTVAIGLVYESAVVW